MSNTKLMPAVSGTRALGAASIGSWLSAGPACYQLPFQPANHLQIADVIPATGVVSARPNAGVGVTDAARKRGRPPRGEPR